MEKYGASHGLGRAAAGSTNPTKFSELQAVASRNNLQQILEINVALGERIGAIRLLRRPDTYGVRNKAGEIATANFREFLF